MVAFPPVGSNPYGTNSKWATSSSTNCPKLDAAQVENIFAQMNTSQAPAPASSSRRFGWFSRKYKTFSRRGSAKSSA
ncbi:hypothetical protein N7492_002913 [Penicillium capsulatum]|uniref:Uncharacterized protein n=1 Tax=Penicillium capsulatum TaxID=69766 RepID=A0A9W9IK91_9EURO|nr:hypothetical protein N7492_002913 [Penicillium capsulatum]KAJ6122493.1 hypothetical protein N7512_004958 [Penicillium capsulatum]